MAELWSVLNNRFEDVDEFDSFDCDECGAEFDLDEHHSDGDSDFCADCYDNIFGKEYA